MSLCFICGKEADRHDSVGERDLLEVECKRCGVFRITGTAEAMSLGEYEGRRHVLSGHSREISDSKSKTLLINASNLDEIFSSISVPTTLPEKLDRVINYYGDRSEYFGQNVPMDVQNDYPITYSKDYAEFVTLLGYLKGKLLIDYSSGSVVLKYDGQLRYEELKRNPPKTNQAFVAMWFDESMKSAYENGIRKAIEESDLNPKMKALKIDLLEHNDPIDTRILVEIRRSRFVVADLTGNRGGVYFEAGYAMSLGIPVIWLCKEGTQVHFDVGQFPRIIWKNENDLYERLKKKIEGMIF